MTKLIMAVDFNCSAVTTMTVIECKKLLIRELGLAVSKQRPDLWLVNSGTTVVVQHVADTFTRGRLEFEVFGFTPRIVISMRPVLSGPHSDLSAQTLMRVADCMLRHAEGDVGFAVECEQVLLLRRDGVVYVREDFTNHLNADRLDLITVPYRFKALRP